MIDEKLDRDPEFAPPEGGLAKLERFVFGRASSARNPVDAAVAALARDIVATRSDKTYVIDVALSAKQPAEAARLADALTRAYLADQQAARTAAVEHDTSWIDKQIESLRNRLDVAETNVAHFKADNEINDANGKNVAEQELGDIATQLVQARAATTAARARAEQIHKIVAAGREPDATAAAMTSTSLERLRAQYADLTRQEADAKLTYADRHPALLAIQAQERDVKAESRKSCVGSPRAPTMIFRLPKTTNG